MRNKQNITFGLSILFIATFILFYQGSAVNSNFNSFNVTPDYVSFNWTFGTISITSNANSSSYGIQNNSDTAITSQYFDSSVYTDNNYPGYTGVNRSVICFASGASGMKFLVQNASSGTYTDVTDLLNQTNSTLYNLIAYQFCPPGYYNGTFNVTNGTSDYANVSVLINIPVNPANTFYEPNNTAFVKGTLAANSNLIHKYYFNTSIAQNLTGVTLNLSGQTEDIDLYLFDSSGSLLARSVENGSAREEINSNLPSTPDIWSFWIFGNTTVQNYQANMYFTTLNVTNATNQKVTSINFGNLDPINNQSSQVNITLNNTDTRAWNGVMEKSEIYRTDVWNNRNAAGDYYFLVPHFATKVKVKIEWKGGTRWFISLNSTNAFLGNSSRKYQTGNLTNTVEEENILYTGTIDTSNDGLWKITIGNITTPAVDNYNVTAQVWYNSAAWLSSNYPADGFNFKASNESENVSKNISLRITLPLPYIANGNYSGFVDYYEPGQWNTRIPISFTVKAGTLLVNNTLSSTSETKYDNIGFNRAGDNIAITLPINNTGGYDIYFVSTTSNYTLWKDSSYMNFTVEWPSNPIEDGSSATLKINITINTTKTANSAGLYYGWILLNTTNSTNSSSSSYPFDSFYIYLYVNLSSTLTLNITAVNPTFVAAPINATNMTFNVTVQLANGSIISKLDMLNETNFGSMILIEQNISYYSSSTTLTSLGRSGTTLPWDIVCPLSGGYNYCRVNGTLPTGAPGGTYYATISSSVNTSKLGGTGDATLLGDGQSATLVTVNDTGLRITVKDGHISQINEGYDLYETKSAYFTVNVRNYGPVQANNAYVTLNNPNSCQVNIQTSSINTSCSEVPISPGYNITLAGYSLIAESCNLTWRVEAKSVDSDPGACDLNMGFRSSHANFGNLTYITVVVKDNATTTGGQEEGGQQGQQQTCTSNSTCSDTQYCKNSACVALSCKSGWYASNHKCNPSAGSLEIVNYTTKVYVLQGGSNSTKVTIKNNGGYTYTTKLEVASSFDGLTSSASPTSYSLGTGNSGIFTLNFSVTSSAEIGYHTITLKTYANENSSIYTMKNVTIAVEPLEETKAGINNTENDLKSQFVSITTLFNQIPPNSEANYTLANRTYYRLLNMFQDIENYIKAGNYLEANSLLKEANSSLAEFKQQISQLSTGGGLLPLGGFEGTLTLVAIFMVIIVIGGFLAYLLMPSKKGGGYHPVLGYVPKEKASIAYRIKHLFSKIKKPKFSFGGGGQKTLQQFDKNAPPVQRPAEPQRPAERKAYTEGYHKLDQFPLSYDKNKFKEKK